MHPGVGYLYASLFLRCIARSPNHRYILLKDPEANEQNLMQSIEPVQQFLK